MSLSPVTGSCSNNEMIGPALNPIDWTVPVNISAGRRMLDNLATSQNPPISSLGLGQSDWDAWWKLVNEEDRISMTAADKEAIDECLRVALRQEFGPNSVSRELVNDKIKDLISMLKAEDGSADAHFSPKIYRALAHLFIVLDRDPSWEAERQQLDEWEIDEMGRIIDFVPRQAVMTYIARHAANIAAARDRILHIIEVRGLTYEDIYGHRLDANAIEVLRQYHAANRDTDE